jgi:adenylate cyclase
VGVEIERRYLVVSSAWRADAGPGRNFRQGYLKKGGVKVRIRSGAGWASLTVKGPRNGVARVEFDYPIPIDDAEQMLRICHQPLVEKTRHEVRHHGHIWEVDVFEGANAGLVLAEIELSAPDEPFKLPTWVGPEVTGDPKYGHESLLERPPYDNWGLRLAEPRTF